MICLIGTGMWHITERACCIFTGQPQEIVVGTSAQMFAFASLQHNPDRHETKAKILHDTKTSKLSNTRQSQSDLAKRFDTHPTTIRRTHFMYHAYGGVLYNTLIRETMGILTDSAVALGGRALDSLIRCRPDETPMRCCVVDDPNSWASLREEVDDGLPADGDQLEEDWLKDLGGETSDTAPTKLVVTDWLVDHLNSFGEKMNYLFTYMGPLNCQFTPLFIYSSLLTRTCSSFQCRILSIVSA